MQPYQDLNHDSGVASFEITENSIDVLFKDRWAYLYTYASAGSLNIGAMKTLALAGRGLNSYINKHVKKLYASKRYV